MYWTSHGIKQDCSGIAKETETPAAVLKRGDDKAVAEVLRIRRKECDRKRQMAINRARADSDGCSGE